MDESLLNYFEEELSHLREVCAAFAANESNSKVASRLDISTDPHQPSRDPYVKMLLEGSAFLAARVRHKLDAEFPNFTQSLFEVIFPSFLCPVPSMALLDFSPLLGDTALLRGYTIPVHTLLTGEEMKGRSTTCTFRTTQPVTLWPIVLEEAAYYGSRGIENLRLPPEVKAKAALKFKLSSPVPFAELGAPFQKGEDVAKLNKLVFHLRDDGKGVERGPGRFPSAILERLFAHGAGILLRSGGEAPKHQLLSSECIERVGFGRHESLLPDDNRSYSGMRLLREYFAFPNAFLAFAVTGLSSFLSECEENEIEILLLFSEEDSVLEEIEAGSNIQAADRFRLFTTPCINLFAKDFDRINLDEGLREYTVYPDKTLPLDYEVYTIQKVQGFGIRPEEKMEFRPFYATRDDDNKASGFYMAYRQRRTVTEAEKQFGRSVEYAGTETSISLVTPSAPPVAPTLRQIGLSGLCTNRHLPLDSAVSTARPFLQPTEISGPFKPKVECIHRPTSPIEAPATDAGYWELLNYLSTNFLSLADCAPSVAAESLRAAIRKIVDNRRRALKRQVEGIVELRVGPVIRRLPQPPPPEPPGPVATVRGVEVIIEFDESLFSGSSVFVLGMILDEFFSRFAPINSFAQTVICSRQRGLIVRWPARVGTRQLI